MAIRAPDGANKRSFSLFDYFPFYFPWFSFSFFLFWRKCLQPQQGPRTSNTNTQQIRIYLMIYVVAQINLSWFFGEIIKIIEVKPWLKGLPTWPKSPTRLVLTTILRQERRMTKAFKAIDLFHNMKRWKNDFLPYHSWCHTSKTDRKCSYRFKNNV